MQIGSMKRNNRLVFWIALIGFTACWGGTASAASHLQANLSIDDLPAGHYPVIASGPGLVVCEPVFLFED